MVCADSNVRRGSREILRSWAGIDWFDTTVEMCRKVKSQREKG